MSTGGPAKGKLYTPAEMGASEGKIAQLEAEIQSLKVQMQNMENSIDALEHIIYAEDVPIDEVDELEAAHLQFAGLVRARREGSA